MLVLVQFMYKPTRQREICIDAVRYPSLCKFHMQRCSRNCRTCLRPRTVHVPNMICRPTFRRIVRNQSTKQFSGSPYICTLLNSLISLWYGLPLVSPGIIMVATVNGIGVVFQAFYIIVYITYSTKAKKLKMLGLSISVLMLVLAMVFISLRFFDLRSRQIFVGYLSVASVISMFASPLFIMKLVIKTKSVVYMPFYLSLSTILTSLSFLAYGLFKADPFIYFPNGIGTILGTSQLALYFYYKNVSTEDLREPFMNSRA